MGTERKQRYRKIRVLRTLGAMMALGAMACAANHELDVGDGAVGSVSSPLVVRDLVLQNGWTNAPYSTRNAGISIASGIVHFKGAIANGANAVAFTLPSGFRPVVTTYVPVHLCNATKGRLIIQATGDVFIQA